MTEHVGPCLVPSYVRSWIGPAVIKEGLVPRDFDRWSTLSALPISSHCLDFNDLDDYEEEDRLKLELEARRGVSQDTLLKDVIPIDRHRNSEWMDLLVIIPNMHMGEPQSEPTSAPVPDLNPVASLLPNHKRVAVNPSRDRVVPKRLREVTPEQDPDCPTLPVKHHQLDESEHLNFLPNDSEAQPPLFTVTVGCKNCDACKHEMHYWKLTGKERLMRLILSPHLPTPNSCMPTIEDFLSHRYIDLTYLQELYYTSFEGTLFSSVIQSLPGADLIALLQATRRMSNIPTQPDLLLSPGLGSGSPNFSSIAPNIWHSTSGITGQRFLIKARYPHFRHSLLSPCDLTTLIYTISDRSQDVRPPHCVL